jgi:acyl-CoA thioesterase FadM
LLFAENSNVVSGAMVSIACDFLRSREFSARIELSTRQAETRHRVRIEAEIHSQKQADVSAFGQISSKHQARAQKQKRPAFHKEHRR